MKEETLCRNRIALTIFMFVYSIISKTARPIEILSLVLAFIKEGLYFWIMNISIFYFFYLLGGGKG